MKQKGFTLIELLVVVAIIGILAAVGVVAYNGYTASAKRNATLQQHTQAVKFINNNDSPGLKRGGVLNIVRRKVELRCPADNIPEDITIDLAGTDIGTSIKISSVKLPENVTPVITDRDFVIATVAAPTIIKEPEKPAEGEAAEGAEGEAAAEGAEATSETSGKEGEQAKKDDKGKDASTDKKPADKKPAEKKPAEKK